MDDFLGSEVAPPFARKETKVIDILIGLCYVAIVLTPAIVASVQFAKPRSGDL
jgi:hypothetical protein